MGTERRKQRQCRGALGGPGPGYIGGEGKTGHRAGRSPDHAATFTTIHYKRTTVMERTLEADSSGTTPPFLTLAAEFDTP